MAQAACEVSWIDILLHDFGIIRTKPVPLFYDNQVAVYITSNATFHERTKHIEIDCHTIRERYKSGLVKLLHVKGVLQLADVFTKLLFVGPFTRLLSKMSLSNIHAHLEGECKSMHGKEKRKPTAVEGKKAKPEKKKA